MVILIVIVVVMDLIVVVAGKCVKKSIECNSTSIVVMLNVIVMDTVIAEARVIVVIVEVKL